MSLNVKSKAIFHHRPCRQGRIVFIREVFPRIETDFRPTPPYFPTFRKNIMFHYPRERYMRGTARGRNRIRPHIASRLACFSASRAGYRRYPDPMFNRMSTSPPSSYTICFAVPESDGTAPETSSRKNSTERPVHWANSAADMSWRSRCVSSARPGDEE